MTEQEQGQKSTLRAESRRTLRLYSDLLDWYRLAASPLAGLAQFGSVSRDCTEVRMVDTLWMGDLHAEHVSHQAAAANCWE